MRQKLLGYVRNVVEDFESRQLELRFLVEKAGRDMTKLARAKTAAGKSSAPPPTMTMRTAAPFAR